MKLFRNNPSFIETYDNQLTKEECNELIQQFESSPQVCGKSYYKNEHVINHFVKKDLELINCKLSNDTFISNKVIETLVPCIRQYNLKYESLECIPQWTLDDVYTFQKYVDDSDGFKLWHTEHGNQDNTSRRVLVWMIYLNDAKSGTDFYHYGRINAKRGRVVIWPSSFTHVHRSQLPNKGIKYLITGWIKFI